MLNSHVLIEKRSLVVKPSGALDYARQRAAELSDAQDGPVPAAAENNASQAAGDAMEEGILDL